MSVSEVRATLIKMWSGRWSWRWKESPVKGGNWVEAEKKPVVKNSWPAVEVDSHQQNWHRASLSDGKWAACSPCFLLTEENSLLCLSLNRIKIFFWGGIFNDFTNSLEVVTLLLNFSMVLTYDGQVSFSSFYTHKEVTWGHLLVKISGQVGNLQIREVSELSVQQSNIVAKKCCFLMLPVWMLFPAKELWALLRRRHRNLLFVSP